jgi:hypothetical protein
MNLDIAADDSCLDPHVSCVKASHPAAQLDVNPEQRSIRQSLMSGPHHGDRAHIHTTFGTSRKFIRASSSRSGIASCHQAPPRSVNVRITASRLRQAGYDHATGSAQAFTLPATNRATSPNMNVTERGLGSMLSVQVSSPQLLWRVGLRSLRSGSRRGQYLPRCRLFGLRPSGGPVSEP